MKSLRKISVIVSTYNSADYLKAVLAALNKQSSHDFEVIVADDGSGADTRQLIETVRKTANYDLIHAWHEDNGFRAAAARNHAVHLCSGEYLVFLDGDCLVLPEFIAEHGGCAEVGYFVRGSRVMLSEAFTLSVLAGEPLPSSLAGWMKLQWSGGVKRITPLFPLPFARYTKKSSWYGVKTCNLGVWRTDFERINGFDERYVGWGHEDADMAVRLIRSGIGRKEGKNCAPVIHLWHKENDRGRLSDNEQRLKDVIHADYIQAVNGLDQYKINT